MTMPLDGYFDYNATTPLCHEALQAQRLAETEFANPSGKYGMAKKAKEALALAREQVARMINSNSDEIAFTSGGTEGNNWAIKGAGARHSLSRGWRTGGRQDPRRCARAGNGHNVVRGTQVLWAQGRGRPLC